VDTLGKVDNFKADFNPRAGLIFYPLEHINVKALYSTAYRAPSLDELYLDFFTMSGKMVPHNDTEWIYPGHTYNLDPEKVYTYDFGINYQDDKVRFGINGFYSKMKNLITQAQGTMMVGVWDNLGEVTVSGLECEGTYYLTRNLLFEGSFLFQQTKNLKSSEENITPLPNFSVKGGLSYRSDFGLTLSAFNTFEPAPDQKYWSSLNKTTKNFNMTNVHCSYDMNKLFGLSKAKELSLVLNIDDLLGTEVWLPAWGMIYGSTIPYVQGRTIYGGFKVAF